MATERDYLERVRRAFGLTFATARLVTQGNNNEVLIADERFVFRFPHGPRQRRRLLDEAALLAGIGPRLKVHVPQYVYLAADGAVGGYALLRGDPFRPHLLRTVGPSGKRRIARELGHFLQRLHSIPLSTTDTLNVPRSAPPDLDLVLETCASVLYPHLSERELGAVELFVATYGEVVRLPHRPVLTHGGLRRNHVLIDRTTASVTGVIDFGTRAIADPAIDFARLFEYGPSFVKSVCGSYRARDEAHLLDRAFQHYRWVCLMRLLNALRSKPGARPVEQAFRGFRAAFAGTPRIVSALGPPAQALASARRGTGEERVSRMVALDIEPIVPPGSSFILVEKGDRLPISGGRRAIPFPERAGQWAGYPADDAEAIAELERLRALGIHFVVVPKPMFYWLEAYPGLDAHLRAQGMLRVDNERALVVELP